MTEDRCILGLDPLPDALRGGVLTIGNFDGVHLGHQRILRGARELAGEAGLPVVAMTFEPPPDLVLRPEDAPQRLVPPEEKRRLLRAHGADWVVTVPAEPKLLAMEPAEFTEKVIARRLAPRHVVEGRSFFFGRGRSGTIETLREAGPGAGFQAHVAEPVTLALDGREQVVSSTLIRGLVAAGRVEDAGRCLGREFTLYGRVVPGRRVGRALEFPTANLSPGEQVRPGDGVYAGRAAIRGLSYAAAISVGTQPTLTGGGDAHWAVEAFLLDAEGDFYDEAMALGFVRRLRDQRRFDGVEPLRAQMSEDVARVRQICG